MMSSLYRILWIQVYKAEEFEFLDEKHWFIVKEVHFQLMIDIKK